MYTPTILLPEHADERQRLSERTRRRLYEKAREAVRVDRGTPYPCSQKDLDGYLELPPSIPLGSLVSEVQATNEICVWLNHHNKPDAPSMAALERLHNNINKEPWGPDLAIKAFKDLDIAFFMGTLLGHVQVQWMCRTEFAQAHGPVPCYGITSRKGPGRCRITLNAESLFLMRTVTPYPFKQMFATVLHEMCVSSHTCQQAACSSLEGSCRNPFIFAQKERSLICRDPSHSTHIYSLDVTCLREGWHPILENSLLQTATVLSSAVLPIPSTVVQDIF